jgi:hypothetical protein
MWHDIPMKSHNEMIEGTEAWTRFHSTMKRVMTVSPQELKRRIEAERRVSAANPNRRGPKPKASTSGRAAKTN